MSLKGKFEHKSHSMEKQGIISKLDHNQATEWLNSFAYVGFSFCLTSCVIKVSLKQNS